MKSLKKETTIIGVNMLLFSHEWFDERGDLSESEKARSIYDSSCIFWRLLCKIKDTNLVDTCLKGTGESDIWWGCDQNARCHWCFSDRREKMFFLSSHLKAMQREIQCCPQICTFLEGVWGCNNDGWEWKILNKRKNPRKKVLFKSFIASLDGGFFPGKEKSMFRKNKSSTCKSLYVRSHIECEKRNSAVS